MAITIKSEREIELMAEAGKILERVHNELEKVLRPGMSTKDVDTLGEEIIRSYGCIPSFLNYNGYPASICVSVNQEVVHGIPDKHRIIHEGDIVTVTEGVLPSNYYYTIDPSLAMSGNVPFRERLMARSGKVLSVVENERGFYVTVEFDEK